MEIPVSCQHILSFAGSLRRQSYNKQLARIAARGAMEEGAQVTTIDLREYPLPVYDGDEETEHGLPENCLRLKELFCQHDGLLLACPEYNGSMTAAMKNTIDWVSRPREGERPMECFAGKVAALVSASPGALGGLRGMLALRIVLAHIRVLVLPEYQSISHAHEAFAADGSLKDQDQQERVEAIGASLAKSIQKLA
jgi:NAD(P)H-dependent FMN reductase